MPGKIRISALAREIGVSSREAIAALATLGVEGKTASSTLEPEVADQVRAHFPAADTSPPAAEAAPAADPASEAAAPEPAAPRKRAAAKTPRKRAAAKTAEVADAVATPEAAAEAPGDPAPAAAPGVLFMAPADAEPEAEQKPRRRPAKKAAKKAAAKATPDSGDAASDATAEPTGDAAAAPEDGTADADDVREAAIEQANGARRRRRRGRRGRGGAKAGDNHDDTGDNDDTGDTDNHDDTGDDSDHSDHSDHSGTDAGNDATSENGDEDGDGGSSSSRRRRRRRRAGSSDDASGDSGDSAGQDDPPNTVTHVREAKKDKPEKNKGGAKSDDDGVRGVKGSTRLEAKRQRRRDGRETSRRRAPILTEAEFLARREAVDRVMAVRQHGDRTQIAVLEDDILVEHYVTRASATSYVGNVYLGRVQNVLPSMEAAFVDIGKGRNGVLYAGEVNWDAAGLDGKSRAIENAMKSGDTVLVQVTKDPIGHKGARLTSQISLPGRFLVLVPGGGMTGISRRLPDTERHRLKAILKKIVPDDAGVIVRTAAEGASEEDLTRDVERLTSQWATIQEKSSAYKSAPTLVHGEPDIAIRVVRDVFNEDFSKLTVQGDDAWSRLKEYIGGVAPDLAERLSRHTADTDLFGDLRVDEQLAKALDRKVWLPSGGSLVIDRTEAMTVVDVNTGKFVGSGGNLEQTVTRNNLEAAEEIVRQLRLRDVGGIVVIDFIDMVLESNRELVLRRLTECLGRDRTKHQVAEVTSLGLVQMTRKRVGEGLLEAFSEPCDHCHGRGVIVHGEPVDKPSGGPSSDESPGGSGGSGGGSKKRRRGGRGAGASGAEEEPPPAANDEQRQAASAAIAAIHRAAGGERPDGEDGTPLVDELASGLFNAALAKDEIRAETKAETRNETSAETGAEAETGAATETVHSSAPVETETAPTASPDEPAAAVPTVTGPDDSPASDERPTPAGRRRRRSASRPTAAPPTAEAAVIVVDPADAPEPPAAPGQHADVHPDEAPTGASSTGGASSDNGAPVARRPRRRAASRPAGPPA